MVYRRKREESEQRTYVHMLPGGDGEPQQFLDGRLLPLLVHHLRPTFVISLAEPNVLPLSQSRGSTEHLLQLFVDGSRAFLWGYRQVSWPLGDPLGGWRRSDLFLEVLGRYSPTAHMKQ